MPRIHYDILFIRHYKVIYSIIFCHISFVPAVGDRFLYSLTAAIQSLTWLHYSKFWWFWMVHVSCQKWQQHPYECKHQEGNLVVLKLLEKIFTADLLQGANIAVVTRLWLSFMFWILYRPWLHLTTMPIRC